MTRTEVAPVWDGEAFLPVQMVPLDLSYDHRVINGAERNRFGKLDPAANVVSRFQSSKGGDLHPDYQANTGDSQSSLRLAP
ncbi:2-oxo acid dehydrogenase subunit E2 [Labrenzia sp. ac12]